MQGLQIFDANGRINFDTSFNTCRVFGTVPQIGLYAKSGSLVDPRFATGRPFAMVSPRSIGNSSYGYPMVASLDVSISGNTLSWIIYSAGGHASVDCGTILFGVY